MLAGQWWNWLWCETTGIGESWVGLILRLGDVSVPWPEHTYHMKQRAGLCPVPWMATSLFPIWALACREFWDGLRLKKSEPMWSAYFGAMVARRRGLQGTLEVRDRGEYQRSPYQCPIRLRSPNRFMVGYFPVRDFLFRLGEICLWPKHVCWEHFALCILTYCICIRPILTMGINYTVENNAAQRIG